MVDCKLAVSVRTPVLSGVMTITHHDFLKGAFG
jgi:hypothetical protein